MHTDTDTDILFARHLTKSCSEGLPQLRAQQWRQFKPGERNCNVLCVLSLIKKPSRLGIHLKEIDTGTKGRP